MRALVMSFAICALIVPLEMIDDLVFHNDGFDPAGLNAGIALVAIYVAVFCFCALRPKLGMRGKQWIDLQNRLAVRQTQSDRSAQVAGVLATQATERLLQKSENKAAQALGDAAQVAGAVGAVSTAADMLSESANNAEAMAKAYGVPVPNIKKQLIAFSIVPVLALAAIYIPQYAQGSQETQEKIALAAEQIDMASSALAPVCERVSADDPYEEYKDYGYHVRGRSLHLPDLRRIRDDHGNSLLRRRRCRGEPRGKPEPGRARFPIPQCSAQRPERIRCRPRAARNVRYPRRFQRDLPGRVVLRGRPRKQQQHPRSCRLLLRHRIGGGIRRIFEAADHALGMEGEFVALSSARGTED